MKLKNLIAPLIVGLAGGILGAFLFTHINQDNNSHNEHELVSDYFDNKSHDTQFKTVSYPSYSENMSMDFTYAAEKGLPTVVHVKTTYNQPNYTLYDFIFGTTPRNSTPIMSSGSGVIISSDGYIVTNNHVIENVEVIEIVLSNREAYPAKLVGRDATTDLALLKIEATNLPYIDYGNSDDIKIGEWVLAIGNPFNLTSTATAGIVSAKSRNINIMSDNMAIESFIQTDAAVNPGNSGGALVNTKGELIGINTAIASRTGSFVGYSFAVPVNIVRKVVADLVEFGEVQRAYLGMDLIDIDANVVKKFNIDNTEGVYVARVWQNSAGHKAGIKENDVILGINNHRINSSAELLGHTSQFRPGDEIELTIKRGKDIKKYKVIMQNKHGDTGLVKSKSIDKLGARFEPISDYEKNRLKIKNGLQVTDVVAGKFAANGIKKNFIIVKVNNNFVSKVEDLENAIQKSDGGLFIEGIYPNGSSAYYAFKL
ncbi:MAG: trypsin-like peptidase domain-containing protein [Bacteroidales bacterium]|jgi:Do/DeqQ family serine protease|nr:trypsin-like peptidase domain-containing protein [Bacteroidales bacterium]